MAKVMFSNQYGQNTTKEMEHIPRIGDTIPVFHEPYPKVKAVVWFPEMVMHDFRDMGVDVLVTVE